MDFTEEVCHPKHYNSGGLEAIDVIEAFTVDLSGIEATDTGNIIKYALRWNKKDGIKDLEKLIWYTNHLIQHLKSKQADNNYEDVAPDIDKFDKKAKEVNRKGGSK